MKKFELTTESKQWKWKTFYRIKACIDFRTADGTEVKAGDLGGWVEKESNLSQDGNAWIFDNASVGSDATVCDNAMVYENARVDDNARVCGNVKLRGDATVCENATVGENARVDGFATIRGNACVAGDARVGDYAKIRGNALVGCNVKLRDNATICDDASISSPAHMFYVTPINEYADSLTVFRSRSCGLKIYFCETVYTKSEFLAAVSKWKNTRARKVALAAIDLAMKYIDLESGA